MPQEPEVYLEPDEYKAIQMALANLLDALRSQRMKHIDWNSEARKGFDEIMVAAESAAVKIEKVSGIPAVLPSFKPGDEKKYLNSQS